MRHAEDITKSNIEQIRDNVEFLGKSYQTGNDAFDKCPKSRFEINELNKILHANISSGEILEMIKETTEVFPEHDCEYCHEVSEPRFVFKKENYKNKK